MYMARYYNQKTLKTGSHGDSTVGRAVFLHQYCILFLTHPAIPGAISETEIGVHPEYYHVFSIHTKNIFLILQINHLRQLLVQKPGRIQNQFSEIHGSPTCKQRNRSIFLNLFHNFTSKQYMGSLTEVNNLQKENYKSLLLLLKEI